MPGPKVAPTPVRQPDSEKITINLGFVDLGQIDLLVADGFYANRTDFIRTAIRHQLTRHEEAVAAGTRRRRLELGLVRFGRAELEAAVSDGAVLDVAVLGLASFADDVTPALARQAIGSLHVLGSLQASPDVKTALADRMR